MSPPPAVLRRRHPLLSKQSTLSSSSTATNSARFAEVAGGTAAECAVICCCCPCGILNLAVLALYSLPAGICRRVLRRKRRRLLKRGLVPRRRSSVCGCGCEGAHAVDRQVFPIGLGMAATLNELQEKLDEEEEEVIELEKEMWDTFYSTGFWRSPSQRES